MTRTMQVITVNNAMCLNCNVSFSSWSKKFLSLSLPLSPRNQKGNIKIIFELLFWLQSEPNNCLLKFCAILFPSFISFYFHQFLLSPRCFATKKKEQLIISGKEIIKLWIVNKSSSSWWFGRSCLRRFTMYGAMMIRNVINGMLVLWV